jgi:DNA replication and repair protein RecF
LGTLVPGPPEPRRRLLDWGVFHVEHGFLPEWRQFRRALQQRNAALRESGSPAVLDAWEAELARLAEAVDHHRRAYLDRLAPVFRRLGADLLGAEVSLRYQRGWAADQDLAAALRESRESDQSMGFTRSGPQRADVQFEMDDERSRWRASKGQQKLLASAFVLAQAEQVAAALERPVVLVVDEPAADLDGTRLKALLTAIEAAPAQVFMAAISAEGLGLEGWNSRFHVEHGEAKALL